VIRERVVRDRQPSSSSPAHGQAQSSLAVACACDTPLLAQLHEQAPGRDLSPRCQITEIYYAGDEGGILCKLDFGTEDADPVFFVSITHLTFDRRLPLAREIAAYQKHRVKRLRRSGPTGGAGRYP
jgi:hypothetical protein